MFRTPFTLDRANRVMTAIASLLALAMFVVAAAKVAALGYGVAVVVMALGFAWAMAPRELVVERGEMRIERRAWRALRVPLSSIESASPISDLGKRPIRLFGVGGFFGSYGLFSSDTIGRFRLYATRGGQAVIVRRKGALPIVLTPDDVAGAIDAIDPRPRLLST